MNPAKLCTRDATLAVIAVQKDKFDTRGGGKMEPKGG